MKRFPSNLPVGLYELLEAQAKAAGVPMNQLLVERLAKASEYELRATPPPPEDKTAASGKRTPPGQERLPLLETLVA